MMVESNAVKHTITEKTAIIISIIIYLATLFSLAYISDSDIFIVFLGTMPILLYLITFFYFIRIDSRMGLLWVLPLLFPMIFLFFWYSRMIGLRQIDGPVIAVLDIVVSYVINIFVLFIFGVGQRPKVDSHDVDMLKARLNQAHSELADAEARLYEAKKELTVTKDNFNISLRSIEDKCKAINFVIGRVYSDKRGADSDTRDKLRISSELYNSFSEMTAEFKAQDAEKLHEVLSKIHQKLLQLEKKEADTIFLGKAKSSLARNDNDTILEVMKKNDKDPIADYHSEAKEICNKLMAFLSESYIKSNTYFTN